jgi:hypothetical protein
MPVASALDGFLAVESRAFFGSRVVRFAARTCAHFFDLRTPEFRHKTNIENDLRYESMRAPSKSARGHLVLGRIYF